MFPCLVNFKTTHIFVMGGVIHLQGEQLRRFLRYCTHTGKWKELAPLILANKKVSACTIGNFIYVLGGSGSKPNAEFTIEKLSDPTASNREWASWQLI